MKRDFILIVILIIFSLILFILNLQTGEVEISFSNLIEILTGGQSENPAWNYIVENRLYRSIVALLAGAALSLAGLILQVYFRNPLAGPGVLGISSGASLGVALIVLGGVSGSSLFGYFNSLISGMLGAFLILLLLLAVSKHIKNSVTLLVLGLMLSFFTSAIINVLYQWATVDTTREYVVWSLGSFEGLNSFELIIFSVVIIISLISSVFLIKPLNALVLGEEYASSMGININQTKWVIILTTGVLTAVVTVFCGPIGFLGIAIPQIVRLVTVSKNHLILIPMTIVFGGFLAILSDLIIRLLNNQVPLNTATSLIGAPIIIYTIIRLNKQGY